MDIKEGLVTASTTGYISLSGIDSTVQSTEANAEVEFKKAGSIKFLGINVSVNSRTTTTTYRVRKNAANGTNVISLGASTTGIVEDATPHTDTFAVNDKACYQIVTSTGTQTQSVDSVWSIFESSSTAGIAFMHPNSHVVVTIAVGNTRYSPGIGRLSASTTEDFIKIPYEIGKYTLSNFQIYVSANTVDFTVPCTVRKNKIPGSQTLSVTANTTGRFTDTTNTDTFSNFDAITYEIVNTGGGTISYYGFGCFATAQPAEVKSQLYTGGNVAQAANVTSYYPIGSSGTPTRTTESQVQLTLRPAGTLSLFECELATNNNTASVTYRVRKNTANGNQTTSVPASTTGVFTDNTNTDTVAAGDLFNYVIITAGSGNTHYWKYMRCFLQTNDPSLTDTKYAATGLNLGTASTTRYASLNADNNNSYSTTEAPVQFKIKKAGLLKYLDCRVYTNTRTTAGTVRSRKNTANGALTVSITASTTGSFVDNANSDTIAVDESYKYLIYYRYTYR